MPGVTRSWRRQEGFSARAFGESVTPSKPCFPAPELWENQFQLFEDTKFPAALETNTNGRITLENCLAVSYETKQRSTMGLSNWTPTEMKTKTYTGTVIAAFFYNSPKPETKPNVQQQLNKQTICGRFTQQTIKRNKLLIHTTTWINLRNYYAKWKQINPRTRGVCFPLNELLENTDSSTATGNISGVAREPRWGKRLTANQQEKISGRDWNVLCQVWWWFLTCIHLSKLIRLYTINGGKLLYGNYTLMKLMRKWAVSWVIEHFPFKI